MILEKRIDFRLWRRLNLVINFVFKVLVRKNILWVGGKTNFCGFVWKLNFTVLVKHNLIIFEKFFGVGNAVLHKPNFTILVKNSILPFWWKTNFKFLGKFLILWLIWENLILKFWWKEKLNFYITLILPELGLQILSQKNRLGMFNYLRA